MDEMFVAQKDDSQLPLEADLFKMEFKYYKSKRKIPDLSQVLDIRKDSRKESRYFAWKEIYIGCNDLGIKSTVKVTELPSVPGFLLIPEAFTPAGLHYWTHRCLVDFPERPNVTNLETLPASITRRIGEGKVILDEELRTRLRWATLGYHHNWKTKVYDVENYTTFPPDLARCAAMFAEKVAGYTYEYRAEAGIINYYSLGTALSGHVDYSEEDQSAPLVSISLGCTCVFLIGGAERSVRPTPVFLRHGDVSIMTGLSRLAYHGVPRVIVEKSTPLSNDLRTSCPDAGLEKSETLDHCGSEPNANKDGDVVFCKDGICRSYLKNNRINITVRQVFKPDI
ncbi:alpha-ketoglutarate-dependent dioxygenase abh1-like [Tropilaelaps mercedesae]|uniref:Alpha-ketoglutarate-dependent dioxygenase abh1-like n=1 Tax=Tropilaelaps mercedesae TaxID=418985 RepID=A0A1V9XGJ4_9ACAR|nr:alpha-ketoglutarate-dependent dioxygenase abh1-like [Tropilaelaps mercedesae]